MGTEIEFSRNPRTSNSLQALKPRLVTTEQKGAGVFVAVFFRVIMFGRHRVTWGIFVKGRYASSIHTIWTG